MGDAAEPRAGSHVIPFSVFGVLSAESLIRGELNTRGCEPFPRCAGKFCSHSHF